MGTPIMGYHQICRDIADALGLESVPYVVDVDLRMHCDSVVSATVKFYPDEDGLAKLSAIIKKYNFEFIEIKETK